jgi:hypothetical protein
MRPEIRPADFEDDAEKIVKLLASDLNPRYDRARFDWLYCRNPAGRARVWVAVEPDHGEIVGTAAAIPRAVEIEGRTELAWVLSDFCVAERHRSLGLALQLQRACLAPIEQGEIAFGYDFPSGGMLAVYRRLGIGSDRQVRRFARVLRPGRRLGEMGLPSVFAAALDAASNVVTRSRRRHGAAEIEVATHEGSCGEEFSELGRIAAASHRLCQQRSGSFLDWRFRECPFQEYEILTARCRGRLVAYVVAARHPQRALLVDLFGLDEGAVVGAALAGALAHLRRQAVTTVDMVFTDEHPWAAHLRALGFRRRETSPMVVYAAAAPERITAALASPGWLITQGDRDS